MTIAATTYDIVSVTATDVAAVTADELKLATDLSIDDSRSETDLTHLGTDFVVTVAGPRTLSFSLNGTFDPTDTVIQRLKTGYEGNTKVWLTVIYDNAATAGQKGMRYPCYVTSFSKSAQGGGVVTFSATLKLADGTPVAV